MTSRKRSQTIVADSIEEYLEKSKEQMKNQDSLSLSSCKRSSKNPKGKKSLKDSRKYSSLPEELYSIPEEENYDENELEMSEDEDSDPIF
jgi:hypothetical protein